MTKHYLVLFCFWAAPACLLFAQVNYSANNQVLPYEGGFHPAANIGEYTAFSENQLALLAAGGPAPTGGSVMGAGVKSLRPGLFEGFLEVAGYDSKLADFQYFKELGMTDHTVIVGFPSDAHKETVQYCPGIRSELFANLYTPIWDGGANGTPYNDENYYAAYLYRTVSIYKDYVKFWEIWNEPGFDYTGGIGYLPPGAPGSWWDNNPDPCDYKLRAPIFHYVRLLRISWEVIKTLDPEAYVVVSGTGYPSFLDAILRNTDNPSDGSVTTDFPLKGGAYFDVMGYHSYPHFDGSLRVWSDAVNDWVYSRHSDGAVNGMLNTKDAYAALLADYGYDGTTFPEKHWLITEVNLPRKPFPDPTDLGENFIGSAEAQRNFMVKAMASCMMNGILQMQVYKLAEDTYFENANEEFDLMGLYKRLNYNNLNFQLLNEEGIAHKTASDVLFGKTFDPGRTAALNLPATVGGGAFKDLDGNFTYVLWAKTLTDQSEWAAANFSFPVGLGLQDLLRCDWDASVDHEATVQPSNNIALTGTPVFLTERRFSMNAYAGCAPFDLQLAALVPGATAWDWTIATPSGVPATFNGANPTVTLTDPGAYQVILTAKNPAGQVLATQTQDLYVATPPVPDFTFQSSGPIAHFQNGTPAGNYAFDWQFGDGEASVEAVPTHVFLESGTYTVTLNASNQCGGATVSKTVSIVSPSPNPDVLTANDTVPVFGGKFRPGTSWDFIPGWTDEQIADIAAGNPLLNVDGAGLKALRTYIGESFFLQNGYDVKKDLFQHYANLDLQDNTFLLAFPSQQSRDPYFYCPDNQSNLFKDLYLDIWDGGENGTPVNDENPFASYVWNTVNAYKDQVTFWEIYNSPDFDLTGDRAWLPPGDLGNWWENNPDPCEYALGAPIFYYVRSLRIAHEIIHTLDPEAYVTVSGIAFPSFLDAVCRNTDNPLDGSVAAPYPLRGGAYFDAVGFKSYPHFDGSTIFFDVDAGQFAYERHSDAAASGIQRVKDSFETVLANYGYDGANFPAKEWIISEANVPRKQFYDYLGSEEIQRNWVVKAWVESAKNGIRQLDFFRLAESKSFAEATDPFEVMGFYQKMTGIQPFNQTLNHEGMALKTCSDLLFGTEFDSTKTAQMNLPAEIGGGAFRDAAGKFVYVLWAKTTVDQSETANATYSFPISFGISQLVRKTWDFSVTNASTTVLPTNLPLTGAPVFFSETSQPLMPPVAYFEANTTKVCTGEAVQFSSLSLGGPTSWVWTFEGGIPDIHVGETPPAVMWPAAGVYKISLWVENAAGSHTSVQENYITVEAMPLAEFDFVANGATVQFINLSEPGPGSAGTSFEWCYGDGHCDNAQNPNYFYFNNGDYLVSLTTTNNCGSDTYELPVSIGAVPTAKFQQSFWGNCGELLMQFVDQSFSNPTAWHWEFPGAVPATSDLQFPVVTYATGGQKTITFIASNSFGADTVVQEIYVEGPQSLTQAIELCQGTVYQGVTINNDTTLAVILPTWNLGCDSSIVTEIAVVDELQTSYQFELCVGDWFHGVQVFSDTVFVETFALPQGCDSISTTTLLVHPSDTTFLVATIGLGDGYFVGNQIFTQTGEYEVLLETSLGCDSLVLLDLTVTTATTNILPSSLVAVFPNPFSQDLTVETELEEPAIVQIALFDPLGRKVVAWPAQQLGRGRHQIGLAVSSNWAPGLYFAKISIGAEVVTRRLVRQ